MLVRFDSYFDFFELNKESREHGQAAAARASERAGDMMHRKDYEALSAILLHYKPRRIFEIGTYLGVTSDFFLDLLPETRVVSIAFRNPRLAFWRQNFNNSELSRDQIGSAVDAARQSRFTQLLGDSHELDAQSLVEEYGAFDLVFIDGDHSRSGVRMDTELAQKLVRHSGVICWHDANPKANYMEVRRFLEDEMNLSAAATMDDYIGRVACWSRDVEQRLEFKTGRYGAELSVGLSSAR